LLKILLYYITMMETPIPVATTTTTTTTATINNNNMDLEGAISLLSSAPYFLKIKTNPDNTMMIVYPDPEKTPKEIASDNNGVIFLYNAEKGDFTEMCIPSKYTFEATETELSDIISTASSNADFKFIKSIDGTVINMFYNPLSKEWMTSTSRMIDAADSFWTSCFSFDTLFREVLQENYNKRAYNDSLNDDSDCDCVLDTNLYFDREMELKYHPSYHFDPLLLDTNLTYTFILVHPETRNVVEILNPSITFVSAQKKVSDYGNSDNRIKKVDLAKDVLDMFSTLNIEMQTYVSLDYVLSHMKFTPETEYQCLTERGIVFENPNDGYKYKFDFPHFKLVESARGNNKFIVLAYLDLVLKIYSNNIDEKKDAIYKISLLRAHYSTQWLYDFDTIEYKFMYICQEIQRLYFNKYIQKYRIDIPPQYEQTISQLHAIYLKSGQPTTPLSVASLLSEKLSGYQVYTCFLK
jgi:hypothetical protein